MERLQRFSIRKLSIGAVSCVIGTVAFLSYSNEVKAAENTDTSLKIVETNSANNPATSNVTVNNTNKQAVVNTSDQSKSEDSSEVAPTSEKTQLQASQDSSTKVKENNLNTDKSDTTKAVVQPTSLNDENNLRDPDSKDVEVKPKESSNVDTNEQKEKDVTLATNSPASETNASSKPVQTVSPEQSADTTDVQPASDQVESAAANSNAPEKDVSAASASTVLSKQPANADTQLAATTSGVQPFVNLAVESDNNDLTPKHETIDSQWTIHYVNQADHKQELKDPTVITMQYTRTNTPQSDGKIQYGDWSYVPDSFKQTGTPITVKDSNNPVKQDNVDKNGENFDVFTITAMYPTVAGYGFHDGINGTRLRDNLRNNERQADAMSKDFYAEYDVAKPTQETVGSQWRIHYIDSTNHEHELKAPTVINLQYARTNTPQSDGTIQHGDWSYVPGSFKQTGTQITVNDSDNPVKEDNVDKDGKNEDVFIIDAMYPSITGYNFHEGINNARLHDYLLNYDPNGNIQMPTMGRDFYVEYDPISERSVAVKFVDDQFIGQQVGQAITLTGHDGDTVNLNLTVPDKYQLADGQQLPTTYTFAKGSGDLKIHLVHQVVQREATIDVQLGLMTAVRTYSNGEALFTATQNQWKQRNDKSERVNNPLALTPLVKAGTLTGHVGYDLVDKEVVSFGDDWTGLKLGDKTYQMPDGDDVVNGIMAFSDDDTYGKTLKEFSLKYSTNTDTDYANRPWHGYLSVNATNNVFNEEKNDRGSLIYDIYSMGLQAGLAGNESNALAKATGDRAATSVEMSNKNIDLNLLQGYDFDFSEQDGRLRANAILPVAGVYVPYVEKTATRTINVTTPDGKTTAVKQTATLAKQVDFGKDAHPAWTTGEWSSYDAPAIPGYTPSQSQVAKETVTGTTKDQTVNITYTANDGTQTIVYQDEDGSEIDKQVISGKTDEKVKVTPDVPDGYVLKGEVPSEVTIKPDDTPITVTVEHGKSHVTPDKPVNKGDLIPDTKDKHYPEGLTHNDLNKTVTREITITDPTGKKTTTTQTVTFTRGATVDEVTNKVTYDDWSENGKHTFDKVDVPTVPGYTVSGEVPEVVVTPETQSSKVDITYTANDGTQTIVYQDEDGSEVGKQVVPGKTDEKVKVTPDVPDGYVLKGEVPSEVTIKPDDTPITVTVEHGKSHVTPDKPVNKGDLIPGTKDKHYPEGLTHNDLNKTVTREITIIDPTGKKTTTTQTVTFTRGATVDEVTNKVTYDDWSENGKHAFDKVDVPTVPGYTVSGEVPEVVVTPETQSSKVDITYTANAQHMMITYVDDTTGKKLHTDKLDGVSDQDTKYTTVDSIKQYTDLHYKLVSDSTNGKDLIFDHDDNADQSYEVHFVHGTHTINQTTSSKQTIHYVYADDLARHGKAADDNVQQLSFKRDGYNDEVTGTDHWNAWIPANSNYSAVDSPVIQGYTPDKAVIEKSTVNPTDKDTEITIVYNGDKQAARVIYVDKTTNATLTSNNLSGKSDKDSGYNTKDTIEKYQSQHYVLTGDETDGKNVIFDHDDKQDQTYYVYFVHGTKNVSRDHSASFTVHYIYKGGKQAKSDHEQALSFTENGIQDLVTQKITWTPADSQKFDDVVTPVITGYTPDQNEVIGQTANFETGDREVTVTYLPDVQLGHINYIDDNTGKTLTRDDFSGRTNEHEDYTSTDRIQEFENKGYVFVSSDYPDGGFNFDDNDQQDQVFNVHLKHGIVTVTSKNPQIPNTTIDPDPHSPKYPKDINNTNSDVKRTIDYKFKDGKTAQPTVNDSLHFERTVVIDKVTGDVLSDTWTQSQNFNDVHTLAIQGYTPDKTLVSDTNIGHDHQDIIEHVVYSPDAQHMTITYIDDTTGKTLHTDKRDGVSDQDATYTTSDTIKQYEDQHYKLVSDSTKGQDLIFDHDDDADQMYEVHFVHGKHDIDQTTSPKQTIHYVYADDLARQGKAADDNVQQLSFTRDGYNDEVTGIDHWNAWTPANSNYNAVDSPVIQGYTPDKLVVEKSTVNPTDKNVEITVTYSADKQAAHVIYVDKTTNTTLISKDLSGKSDEDSEYNTKDTIGQYKSQHYVLFEDETNGKNVVFDHDDQQDQTYYVYFVHGTQKVNRQDTVTSTIDYKFEDGKTAQPTVTQTKHFSEDGVKDLVTGKITWNEAESQKFDDIATKSIVGYTPDKDNVTGSTVRFGDKDIEVTVTYHNNAQTATITYIDDTEKKTLGSDKQNGKFNHAIIFEHDPAEVIKGLEEKGYKLVSDNFKLGIKYQNDNKFNIFEVHLVHTYEPVETSQTITETVHYIDANGKPVAPDHVAKVVIKVTGTRDKVTDSITWNTPSTGHFDEVISPEVLNMTPDKKLIPGRDVQYSDSDITESVVYTPDEMPREPEKPNKPDNSTSKTPEKPNKSSKEVSKQFGTIAKTTIPEKAIDSRTVDNHVSAKSTAKQELPQTGTTTNTGIWTGLVSMIASLGLLGASKKRKKN